MPQPATRAPLDLDDGDYAMLANFRYALRCFQSFVAEAARRAGLSPQQHQALLSIRGAAGARQTVGELAQRLLIKPNSASELASRLEEQGLLVRAESEDRRLVTLRLTPKAEAVLAGLSRAHLAELERLGPVLKSLAGAEPAAG